MRVDPAPTLCPTTQACLAEPALTFPTTQACLADPALTFPTTLVFRAASKLCRRRRKRCHTPTDGLTAVDRTLLHTDGVPVTSTDRRQRIEIDGKPFLFQHGYRFGKVTYVTRLPLDKSMTVFAPGHLSASEVEAVVRGDNPWMLD